MANSYTLTACFKFSPAIHKWCHFSCFIQHLCLLKNVYIINIEVCITVHCFHFSLMKVILNIFIHIFICSLEKCILKYTFDSFFSVHVVLHSLGMHKNISSNQTYDFEKFSMICLSPWITQCIPVMQYNFCMEVLRFLVPCESFMSSGMTFLFSVFH